MRGGLLLLARLLFFRGRFVLRLGPGFFLRLLFFGRLFALRRLVADELEDGHFRGIAAARSQLDDARVAAGPLRESRPERGEQLRDQAIVAHDALDPTPVMDAVALSEAD